MQIEGIPDGWELVRIGRIKRGEHFVDNCGLAYQWTTCDESGYANYVIIRKIEKPKKYRPFANAEEFKPHRDRWVGVVSEDNNCGCYLDQRDIGGKRKIDGCSEHSICIWEGWMTYRDAFKCFNFDDDGTPFGVEVIDD